MSWSEAKKINSNLAIPLDELVKSGSIPVVKSVQRGTAEYMGTQNNAVNSSVISITINSVNISKCIVIVNGGQLFMNSSISDTAHIPYVVSFDSTKLEIRMSSFSKQRAFASWQVIEFY